ncbi:MAG: hypothetical protein JJLCMIEE_01494 [Acidimicrobiales bacterium]|nr:MAG: hypothetical protein EDR02_06260 [Actinomycetota bacterium]MBV6508432.1 hypothetical protein [Acidimicrobiales bacterium]RIK04760.1 MAG: hypothetical protein DCC48_11955 [Acidobacteriota bacterium]
MATPRRSRIHQLLSGVAWKDRPTRLGIVGPGGSGKTEALDDIAELFEDDGRGVSKARGHRLELDVPYAAFRQLLELPHKPSAAAGLDLAEQILAKLSRGDVLIIDDGQWLDPHSRRVVVAVAERAAEQGLNVVVAHRPDSSPEIAVLDEVLGLDRPLVVLEPLTEEEVGGRMASILGAAVDETLVAAVAARTGGNLLLTDRLVEGWTAQGVIEDGRMKSTPDGPPHEVVETVRSRLNQLDDQSRAVLIAGCLAPGLDDDLITGLTTCGRDGLPGAVHALFAAGLTDEEGTIADIVIDAVESAVGAAERRAFHARLAEMMTTRGLPPDEIAEHLIAARAGGTAVARALVDAGDRKLVDDPVVAQAWYQRAVEVGATPADVAARRAEASARVGDTSDALIRADRVLADRNLPDQGRAKAVAAAALARRGLLGRAADLYCSITDDDRIPVAHYRLLAVPNLLAVGRGEEARRLEAMASEELDGPASLQVEAAALVARGALESISGSATTALEYFVEAAEMVEGGADVFILPDSPHALGALVACTAAEFPVAEHLLERARENEVGGPGLVQRHRLLRGWTGVRTSRWAVAQGTLEEIDRARLSAQEELFATAIEAGLARRAGDLTSLAAAWHRAESVLLRLPASLFLSDVVGELAVGAARLGEWERIVGKARELGDIVRALGEPPLWTLPLRWTGLQAAIAIDDADAVKRRAAEIQAVPPTGGRMSALGPAARAWVTVYDGAFDPYAVQVAAKGLHDVGLSWEASRLVGQAAIRSSDSAVTRALLEKARDLKTALPSATSSSATVSSLSEREQEVARFVVDGLTYKEIGAQLFISPKTVEHHVAKIRQKVGAGTRAEMLAALRDFLPST